MRLLSALACVLVVACQSEGPVGLQGPEGQRGPQGEPGQKGDTGDNGASVVATPLGLSDERCPGGIGGIELVIGTKASVVCNGATGPQGERGFAGPTGLNWLGEWSSPISYSPTDTVSYNGSAYVALASNQGTPPPSAEWSLLAAKGEIGLKGDKGDKGEPGEAGVRGPAGAPGEIGITPRGEWSPSTAYDPRDAVTFNGSSYVATLSSITTPPPGDGWMLLAARGDAGLPGTPGAKGDKGDTGGVGPKGDKGDTGTTGAAGTTGQTVTTNFSTSSLTVTSAQIATVVPGLSQTISVPAGARVLITTYGGLQTTSTTTSGFSMMDVFLQIDGGATAAGAWQRIVAANTAGVFNPGMINYWSITSSPPLSAGSHTIAVSVSGAGSGSSATVAGDASSVLQAELTTTIIKL